MNPQYKPSGYNSVSPYLVVNGAQKMIALLKQIFHAGELRKYATSDGKIMHAEMKIDDSVVMLADASEEYPQNQFLIHVYVPDSSTIYRNAINAGCEPVEEPHQREGEPDRRGSFKDFAGNLWSVSTQVTK